jgi:glutamate synthase (NADPH/NADH) small chain
MGKPTGFKEIQRQDRAFASVADRIEHYNEFTIPLSDQAVGQQGARCMDCGIPFCHSGCPVNNIIPDWNDLVYRDDWESAIDVLHSTNNFPEFTGRICPAPCEASCTLNIDDVPVTIKNIEYSIIEKAWKQGWVKPLIAQHKTGKRIAVVGSGPAGMACAQQLARAGHQVALYEKANRIGGLVRYGIPDFKLDKKIIDRRMAQMRSEGVEFHANTHIGVDIPAQQLVDKYDALVLTGGSEKPRDLPIPGRDLNGVHFALEFLQRNSHRVQGDQVDDFISAEGKHVVVIGGGDTGSDCIGTSIRHGALSVTQIEILPQPPEKEDKGTTWPNWPDRMRTSSSQEEGCERMWCINSTSFIDDGDGNLAGVNCVKVEWTKDEKGAWVMKEIEGSEFVLKTELVTLAMGFLHPVQEGMLEQLSVKFDGRGNVEGSTDGSGAYKTSVDGVFSAGDMRRGQSLVVWAIREGRQCAKAVDGYLMGHSDLPWV